jgi:murein DD-endopeptidase MepM/ murein hydrolase activator NlpD
VDSWNAGGGAIDAAFTRLGFDPTGVRTGNLSLGGDPTGVRQSSGGQRLGDPTMSGYRSWSDQMALAEKQNPQGWDPMLDWGVHALDAQLATYQQQHPGTTGTGSTTYTPQSGWDGVNQWSQDISTASAQTGVDSAIIAGIMKVESNGDPNSSGAPGVWGPMQVNSNAWGTGAWSSDPHANILKGAQIFKTYLDANNGDVREALRAYHGYGSDGNTTDQQYADAVLAQINAYQGSGASWSGQGGGGLTNMFGSYGATIPDWGGFNVPSDNGLYWYSTAYGMNGKNHTGIDVPMPYGTAYRAPMGGTVLCSGTGVGTDEQGGSCLSFQDMSGGGAGRVEVMLDNGTALIFGHSSKAALIPGMRFNAGDILGYSGGENSDHVHLEARVRDSSTASGWRIVDPRTVVGGGGVSGGAGGMFGAAPSNPIIDFLTKPGMHW